MASSLEMDRQGLRDDLGHRLTTLNVSSSGTPTPRRRPLRLLSRHHEAGDSAVLGSSCQGKGRSSVSSVETRSVSPPGDVSEGHTSSSGWEGEASLPSIERPQHGVSLKGTTAYDSYLSASDSGAPSGAPEGPTTASAYEMAAQLRHLGLTIREFTRETSITEAILVSSPRPSSLSPSSKIGDTAAALPSKVQRMLKHIALSLDALTEKASQIATEVRPHGHMPLLGPIVSGVSSASILFLLSPFPVSFLSQCCRWRTAATRQRRHLRCALKENERLVGLLRVSPICSNKRQQVVSPNDALPLSPDAPVSS